jgi:hypothetical protein
VRNDQARRKGMAGGLFAGSSLRFRTAATEVAAMLRATATAAATLLCYLARLSSTAKRAMSRACAPGARAAVANWERDFR